MFFVNVFVLIVRVLGKNGRKHGRSDWKAAKTIKHFLQEYGSA